MDYYVLPWIVILSTHAAAGGVKYFDDSSVKTIKLPLENGESSFGYSISYQPAIKQLIVSAPNDTVVGSIFTCKSTNCTPIKIVGSDYVHVSDNMKHFDWLGATVASSKDYFVTCAPRTLYNKGYTRAKCFKITFKEDSSLNPKVTSMETLTQTEREDFSSDLSSDNKLKVAADCFGWSMFVIDDERLLIGSPFISQGRVIVYDKSLHAIQLKKSTEIKARFNYGYSLTAGKFLKGQDEIIAVSSPFGAVGEGMVLLYSSNLTELETIEDNSTGIIFGKVLCSFKIEDDMSGLLVSAPSKVPSHSSGYDIGVVQVYSEKAKKISLINTVTIESLEGLKKSNGGQFGATVISLGDLDADGIDEVAIAAPYLDKGAGAVYIYSGAEVISKETPNFIQKIESKHYVGFGFSLAKIEEYFSDTSYGLAIGVPINNTVILVKGKNFVEVNLTFELKYIGKADSSSVKNITVCLMLNKPVPVNISSKVKIGVDIRHPSFTIVEQNDIGSYSYIETISTTEPKCKLLHLKTPLKGRYDKPLLYNISAEPGDTLTIINKGRNHSISGTEDLNYCNGTCKPFLLTSLIYDDGLLFVGEANSTKNITIEVTNFKEVAYTACLHLRVRSGAVLLGLPPLCTFVEDHDCTDLCQEIQCAPIEPILYNETWIINNITISVPDMRTDEVSFEVHTYDACQLPEKRILSRSFPLVGDIAEVNVYGYNNHSRVIPVLATDIKNGKQLNYTFTIVNNGVTNFRDYIYCEITIPRKYYMADFTDPVNSNINCTAQPDTDDYVITCRITELMAKQRLFLTVPFCTPPGSIEIADFQDRDEICITGYFKMYIGNETKYYERLETKLQYLHLPLWVIIVAAVVGIVVLMAIVLVLRECGVLQRTKKKELKDYKKRLTIIEVPENLHGVTNESVQVESDHDVTAEDEGFHVIDVADHQELVSDQKIVAQVHKPNDYNTEAFETVTIESNVDPEDEDCSGSNAAIDKFKEKAIVRSGPEQDNVNNQLKNLLKRKHRQ